MIPPFRREFDAARDPDAAFRSLNPRTAAIRGTGTNDSAAAGFVGEYKECINNTPANATVTITQASPAVITDTGHGLSIAALVTFTTTGALPTGLTAGTSYYISSQNYATNSYSVSTSVANALAGTSVDTSSAGSGTHTRVSQQSSLTSGTNIDVGGLSLTAGDWDVEGIVRFAVATTTTITNLQGYISSTSATISNSGLSVTFGGAAINGIYSLLVGRWRISLSVTTNIFLVQRSVFGTSTLGANGKLWARRIR